MTDADDQMFDDMDDDLFGIPETDDLPSNAKDRKEEDPGPGRDESDDENEFSISKIKAAVGFIGDEYVGVTKAKATQEKRKTDTDDDQDDRNSVFSVDLNDEVDVQSSTRGAEELGNNQFQLTNMQAPFQPTSTPTHLEHRFMVWNNIGTIRSYNTEDDDGIDVTFHDASHHQPIHLRNNFDYTMGTLSNEAVIFACAKEKDHPSKLFCIHYGTWDSSKEWTVDMRSDEEILGIGIGDNWICAATNLNRIRLFSLGGVQHFVYEIPGQVVSIIGFNSLVFLTYHYGVGLNQCQSMFYSVLKVRGSTLTPIIQHLPLPISPRSTLSWIGFSEEGTPAFSDSSDCLRVLNGQLWTPFCDMREFLNGPNDHFWVIGFGQLTQTIRAIKCKGAKYPPTLPRPTQLILEAKVPLCELDAEKTKQEDTMLRSLMMRSITKKMECNGFDMDEYRTKALTDLLKSTLNLFELSIKGNRDFRGAEYISKMPLVKGVEAAIKLASQQRKAGLVERLRKIAKGKMDGESDEDETYDDFEKPSVYKVSLAPSASVDHHNYVRTSTMNGNGAYQDSYRDDSFESSHAHIPNSSNGSGVGAADNPLLQKQKEEIRNLCSSTRKSNPFKKVEEEVVKNDSQDVEKGFAFIEAWKKPAEKATDNEFNPRHSSGKGRGKKDTKGSAKPNQPQKSKDKKKQSTLFEMQANGGRKSMTSFSHSNPSSPAVGSEGDANSNMVEGDVDSFQQDSERDCDSETARLSVKRKRNECDEVENIDLSLPFSPLTYSPAKQKSKTLGSISTFARLGDDSE